MSLKRIIKERLMAPVMTCRGPAGDRVALTFDDGPDPERTPQVLAVLGDFGVRASFFLLGDRVKSHPEVVEKIRAAGHDIGNHSMTHADLPSLPLSAYAGEIDAVAALADGAGRPWLGKAYFRPPKGAISAKLLLYCLVKGHRVVLWSADTRDFEAAGPAAILTGLERNGGPRPGDIILMHDRGPHTAAALPEILRRLAAAGLEPVTLSELIG